MERMLCAQCDAVTYSAAARKLVERGESCPRCGGRLAVEPSEPVGVASMTDEPDQRRSTA